MSQAEGCGKENESNTDIQNTKECLKTARETNSDTTTKEVENDAPVSEGNITETQDRCKNNNEATGKENKSSETFNTVSKSIENTDETLQNKNKIIKSYIFNKHTIVYEEPIKANESESAGLPNDCTKFDETGGNTLVNKKENQDLKAKASNELETPDEFNEIKEIVKETEKNQIQIQIEHRKLTTENVEELEYEGIEVIKIPEETVEDEMILPDSANEGEYVAPSSEDEEDKESKHAKEADFEEEDEEELINCGEQTTNDADKIHHEGEYVAHSSDGVDKESKHAEVVDKEELINCGEQKTKDADEIHGENSVKLVRHRVNDNNRFPQNKEKINQVGKSRNNIREVSQEPIENDNEDSTCEEAIMGQPQIEESSDTPTCSIDENNSSQVEFAIEIHTQVDNVPELEETTHIDDPLGQVDSTLEGEIEAICQHISQRTTTASTVNIVEVIQKSLISVNKASAGPDDNDDDDVEIIESRNSPICLDTDDEDEAQVCKVHLNPTPDKTITQPFAVKKHADKRKRFPGNNTSTQMVPKSTIKTTKSITETINLLDSSDEDEVSSSNTSQTNQSSKRIKRRIAAPTVTRSLVKIPALTVGKKRTLLPTSHIPKSINVSQVSSRGSATTAGRVLPSNSIASAGGVQKTPRSVLLFPPTSFKPTPQSNFLNAVNLLPAAATTGDNPLAFAATLSNKNIIIPNAFYANRRTNSKEEEDDTRCTSSTYSVKGSKMPPILISQQQGRRIYREWLEEFIDNFADPQQIISHSCLVLLQGALKYKVFLRIKDLRIALNNKAYTSSGTADAQLRRELHNAFYLTDCRLSGEGLRFCTDACTQIGNNVTLMTDARTGRITLRTNTYEELVAKYGGANDVIDDKKKRNKIDEEYTPAKYYERKVEESNVGQGERRKSLRQHRTRCYDETFLYEPEEVDDDESPTAEKKAATDKRRQDEQMMALVQRKAEEKRLEAKRQREQQVKSFESAYLEMFAKSLCGKNGKTTAAMTCSGKFKYELY